MNKYLEALDFINDSMYRGTIYYNQNDIELLYKLVVKATIPKKPSLEGDGYDDKGNINYDTWICPNCGEHYEVDYQEYEHCPECGQAIDWSKEEESEDE